jgi:hypothetical protein
VSGKAGCDLLVVKTHAGTESEYSFFYAGTNLQQIDSICAPNGNAAFNLIAERFPVEAKMLNSCVI